MDYRLINDVKANDLYSVNRYLQKGASSKATTKIDNYINFCPCVDQLSKNIHTAVPVVRLMLVNAQDCKEQNVQTRSSLKY